MSGGRTGAWYWTRLELAIGVGAVALAALILLLTPAQVHGHAAQELVPAAGFVGLLVGLAWMIRIFRGPRDEPRPWRSRRH